MCDYSRKPVKWQVGNFSLLYKPNDYRCFLIVNINKVT